MTAATPITEFEEITPDTVHLVKTGANGFPVLIAKALEEVDLAAEEAVEKAAKKVDCPTCDGKGKIRAGKVDCPDCDTTGKVTQAKADDLGKAADDTVPDDDGIPGSKTWEAADAARLNTAAQTLLDLKALLSDAAAREQTEGQTVDPDDYEAAWTLQDAVYMLTNLLGVVAALALSEQRESDTAPDPTMAGKSADITSQLTAARDQLTALVGDTTPAVAEKELDMTKDELSAFLDERDAALAAKASTETEPADEAETAPIDDDTATKAAESESAVKSESDTTVIVKAMDTNEFKDALKEQLTELIKGVETRLETVEKMAAPGGPVKTRPPATLAKADQRDALDLEAAELERRAYATSDTTLRTGYLTKAADVRSRMTALRGD
jgi:hypothetical protein